MTPAQTQKTDHFTLQNFEGPLDFLLYLIRTEEIAISEISIHTLTQQLIAKLEEWKAKSVEMGSECLNTLSYLLWMKSKALLPQHTINDAADLAQDDENFEIIHHLIDYCRFKQAAKDLMSKEEIQNGFFTRGFSSPQEQKKSLGIDHISIEELSFLFHQLLKRIPEPPKPIYEEEWRVSDKIKDLQELLSHSPSLPLQEILLLGHSRNEWIVIFLALLELLKSGSASIKKIADKVILSSNRYNL